MSLYPHPTDSASSDFQVDASLNRSLQPVGIVLQFRVRGPIAELDWGPASAQWNERLWERSCLEAFVAMPGRSGYWEWNFTPAGAWAAFTFTDYRTRTAGFPVAAPVVSVDKSTAELSVRAVWAHDIPPLLHWAIASGQPLEFSLNAILADRGGQKSHFALHHSGARPDFHLRENFSGRV